MAIEYLLYLYYDYGFVTEYHIVTYGLITALSFINYCKAKLLIAFVLIIAYCSFRIRVLVPNSNIFYREVAFIVMLYSMVYFYSRDSMKRDREIF